MAKREIYVMFFACARLYASRVFVRIAYVHMPYDSSLAICVFPGGKALKLYINSQRIPKKNSSTGSSFHDVTKENNKDQIENWL